jgi:AraC-like DNA-binding protein
MSFATAMTEDGVSALAAEVNGIGLEELRFPALYAHAPFDFERPYLAVVLDGSVAKSFRRRTVELGPDSALTLPPGAVHGARFGCRGARILIVRPRNADMFDDVARLAGGSATWLATRLAGELRATDAAAPLAAEGLALELLAAARRTRAERRASRPPAWLRAAEELVRERLGDHLGLGELAAEVGVHPGSLARAFRAHHGVTVGEFARRLRVARAATELARGDSPLVEIAASCGFSDQSHFTRVFKQHVGMTPASYRLRAGSRSFHDR